MVKYELKNGNILKDGHTMFLQDVVSDLKRKAYLEDLKSKTDGGATVPCSDGLCSKCQEGKKKRGATETKEISMDEEKTVLEPCPCPFCEEEATWCIFWGKKHYYLKHASNCYLSGVEHFRDTDPKSIRVWNRRAG